MKVQKTGNSGYTLIELAVVMIIIGVLLAPLAAAYSSYMKKKSFEVTEENIALITSALGSFRGVNGRYPCPASLTAARDNPDYGREGDCADTTTIAAGSCADGVCVKESLRSIAGVPIRVRVGAIPFRQLNIDETAAYDAYGQRLTYVVTESLADKDRFRLGGGGIGIVDTQDPPVSVIGTGAQENTAHFIIVSHGANGRGAYLETGVMREACGDPLTDAESINCQDEGEPPVYRQAQYSTATGINHYDDFISYFVRGEVSSWLVNETNPADIYLKDLSPEARVGIDITDDAPLDDRNKVNSIVRAREEIKTTEFCDQGGGNCTYAELIAGTDPNMQCPSGQYMVAIGNNRAQCSGEIYQNCEAGLVVKGVDANGNIQCGEPPVPPVPPRDCASRTVSLCSTNQTLPARPHGSTHTITAGASRTQTFRCDDGTWRSQSTSGVCTCTPRTETRNRSCEYGFEGGIAQTRTYQCPQGVWTPWTTAPGGNTCRCVGATSNWTESCPPEHTGVGTSWRQIFTCNADGTSGSWAPEFIVSPATCACENRSETRTLDCTGGLSGTYTQRRDFTCANNRWSAWSTTVNNCTCEPRPDQTRTQPCPSGYTGSISEARSFECTTSSGSWGPWRETGRNCQIVPVPVCTWEPAGSGLDQTTKRGPRVGDQCTCGATGQCHEVVGANLYYNYTSCSCQ